MLIHAPVSSVEQSVTQFLCGSRESSLNSYPGFHSIYYEYTVQSTFLKSLDHILCCNTMQAWTCQGIVCPL